MLEGLFSRKEHTPFINKPRLCVLDQPRILGFNIAMESSFRVGNRPILRTKCRTKLACIPNRPHVVLFGHWPKELVPHDSTENFGGESNTCSTKCSKQTVIRRSRCTNRCACAR